METYTCIYFCLLCTAALLAIGHGAAVEKCYGNFKKLGCYKEKVIEGMDLIANLRHGSDIELNWNDFEYSVHQLTCRCLKEAASSKAKDYKYFSIRYWGECWATNRTDVSEVLKNADLRHRCSNVCFRICDENDEFSCVGHEHHDYVYEISEWIPGTKCDTEHCRAGMELQRQCPVDGRWGSWSNWEECDKKCGGGSRRRHQFCDNPKPKRKGKDCGDNVYHSEACNLTPCPVDGGLGTWTSWTDCDKECGGGFKSRYQLCDNPKPAYGGKNCSARDDRYQPCNFFPCPANGRYTEWSEWSGCLVGCRKERTRTCTSKHEEDALHDCFPGGIDVQRQYCKTEEDCAVKFVSAWSAWGKCSKPCSTGVRRRYNSTTDEQKYCSKRLCPKCKWVTEDIDFGTDTITFADIRSKEKCLVACLWQWDPSKVGVKMSGAAFSAEINIGCQCLFGHSGSKQKIPNMEHCEFVSKMIK